ncbi:glycosyltransferase [Thermoproteota archaeon]
MKICYVNPTFLIRRPIAELIDRLGNNNDVGILVPKKPFQRVDESWHANKALKKAKIYSFNAVNLPFSKFEWPIPFSFMLFVHLFRIFWRYNVIHVWTYFYWHILWTMFFKLFSPRKKLILSSDTFPGYSFNPGGITNILFKIYTKTCGWYFFSIPNKIHIYGKSMFKFAKKAGVNSKKIIVIPTGIDTSKFSNAKASDRKKIGLKKSDFVLIYAGLIVPRKGIDTMLESLSKLPDKKVELLLVGEGPSKQEYQKMAKKLGVAERVKFLGWRHDIPELMKTSDALFLPSRGEGLPGIVMEAMAAGLPVVASDIPCIPDLVENDKTGFLCEENDVRAFSTAIRKICANPKLADKMGKGGKFKIKQFEWANIIKKYKKVYETI